MSDTLQPQITQLQTALHDIALSLALARANQPAAVAGLQAQFDSIKGQLATLIAKEQAAETPSTFETTVGSFFGGIADGVSTVAKDIGTAIDQTVKAAGNAASGAGTTLKFLPFLLLGVVVVVGIGLYRGSLGLKVQK